MTAQFQIEVHVESGCTACERVVSMLRPNRSELNYTLRIVHRGESVTGPDGSPIVILPATYINNILMFYGEFSAGDLLNAVRYVSQR